MSKKIKLIYFLLVIVLFLAISAFSVFLKNTFSQSSSKKFDIPPITDNGRLMTIKDRNGNSISVANVYAMATEKLSYNGVSFGKNKNYSISFYPQDQSFTISLLNPKIIATRELAENDFLTILDISEKTACDLTVSLGVPASVSEIDSGQNYGLSFCSDSSSFKSSIPIKQTPRCNELALKSLTDAGLKFKTSTFCPISSIGAKDCMNFCGLKIEKAKSIQDLCAEKLTSGSLVISGGTEAQTKATDSHATGNALDFSSDNKASSFLDELYSCLELNKSSLGIIFINKMPNHIHISF